jgi:adenylosuccinate lyase
MAAEMYDNPLVSRYASRSMAALWSDQRKFSTWRRLWIALAESQRELGLDIAPEQVEAMRRAAETIDFAKAAEYEKRFRHDVMAHVHAFGDQCPEARPVIHLGATSAFVTDNTDLLLMRDGLEMLAQRLLRSIDALGRFAAAHRDVACLALTHLQPAQPTTVGKRACLWCYELIIDLEEIDYRIASLRFRGVKGTTGTQASFLQLFDGDHAKVTELDRRVAEKMGFAETYPVTGQTYSRKVDSQVLDAVAGIAQSAHKFGTDLRLLQSRNEIEEPFETEQIGSSAMAYKRNPMRAERMCALARFLMSLPANAAQTAATQWMERTLDDSANRRLSVPQAFLAADAVLRLYHNIATGLVVYPEVVRRHLTEQLPFLATESILMAGVAAGGDRQDIHERIRRHSQAAAQQIKEQGTDNDLLDRLAGDPAFTGVDFAPLVDARAFVGRAPQQVKEFLAAFVEPLRSRLAAETGRDDEITV